MESLGFESRARLTLGTLFAFEWSSTNFTKVPKADWDGALSNFR